MYADNEFLIGLSNKLLEMAENTVDLKTKDELQELSQMALDTCK